MIEKHLCDRNVIRNPQKKVKCDPGFHGMIGPNSPRSCPMGVFDVEDVPKLGKRAVVVPGILRSFEILKAGKI